MNSIASVEDLYHEFIQDIYHAEVLLMPELRMFIEKLDSQQLQQAVKGYLNDTRSHITRLEDLQDKMKVDMMQDHCRTMKSMIVETKELVSRCEAGKVTERAVVASLHRITNCLIVVYQMLVAMADELNLATQKKVLEKNLNEERAFAKQITAFGFRIVLQDFDTKRL